jgi:hypothetical protein
MFSFFRNLWASAAWYILAGSLVAGFAAGTVWYIMADRVSRARAEIRTLNGTILRAVEQRARDKLAMDQLARRNAAISRKHALSEAALQRALTANPDWAAQPVPKEIYETLRKP